MENNQFIDFPLVLIELFAIRNRTEVYIDGNPWSVESREFVKFFDEYNSTINYYEIRKNLKTLYIKRLKEWNVNNLLSRIETNQPLTLFDKNHLDLKKYLTIIKETCSQHDTETSKEMIKILKRRGLD